MELTKHEIHRIFAMYWGCDAIEDGETGKVYSLDEISCPDDVEWGTPYGPRLILRPLSKVTDEDAIVVAKMALDKSVWNAETGRSWLSLAVKDHISSDGYHYGPLPWDVYQYLIQRGYALPLFIAPDHPNNGKTAIELGLAIEREG